MGAWDQRGQHMQLIQPFSTKTLGQTTAGELVKLRTPAGNPFAIILDKDSKAATIGFLEPTGGNQYPVFRRLGSDFQCLSYGSDWLIDLVSGDESWPGNRSYLTATGAILVDAQTAWRSLQPASDDHTSEESYFDLGANKFTRKHPENFTPFMNWRIWQSKEDYLRIGAKPLIDVRAVSGR
jgi:hypothetical protein